MTWIEPLNMKVWIVDVLSGSPIIFSAVSLLMISSMAAYFRMQKGVMFLMLFIFTLLFSQYTGDGFLMLITVIGGLIMGTILSNLVKR